MAAEGVEGGPQPSDDFDVGHAARPHRHVVQQAQRHRFDAAERATAIPEQLGRHAPVAAHELGTKGIQRQHAQCRALPLQALQLFAVPIAGGEGERRNGHAGRLVHVDLAGRIVMFHDRVDPLHHLPYVEEGIRGADRAVGPLMAATVPTVHTAERFGGSVQIDAVDAVLGQQPIDPLGQKILPVAAIADDVGGLLGLAFIFARPGIHQALVVIAVPLGAMSLIS